VRLLIVEDEPFIATDLEMIVTGQGHEVVGVADSLSEAMDQAGAVGPQAALVDINLRDGFTGVEIARRLSSQGVRVGFVTGNLDQIPADFAGANGAVEKPFSDHSVELLLAVLDPEAPVPVETAQMVRRPKPAH
jgi:DNA-binding response OmpR family regulator